MNDDTVHAYHSRRQRYLSELHRLGTQDKSLALMNDYRYEGRLLRSVQEMDEKIAAASLNVGR